MAKYIYPAVFTPEGNGYFIDFPDFDACYTQEVTSQMESPWRKMYSPSC